MSGAFVPNPQLGKKSSDAPSVVPVVVAVFWVAIGSCSLLQPSTGCAADSQSGSAG
jgi:hypothetical protein